MSTTRWARWPRPAPAARISTLLTGWRRWITSRRAGGRGGRGPSQRLALRQPGGGGRLTTDRRASEWGRAVAARAGGSRSLTGGSEAEATAARAGGSLFAGVAGGGWLTILGSV